MSAEDHLSKQFGDLTLHYRNMGAGEDYHTVGGPTYVTGHPQQIIHAFHPNHPGYPIAEMRFEAKSPKGTGKKSTPGKILGVDVAGAYQRRGIATAMWNYGHEVGSPTPKHSDDRTREGDAWAKAVGGTLPKNRPLRGAIRDARNAVRR